MLLNNLSVCCTQVHYYFQLEDRTWCFETATHNDDHVVYVFLLLLLLLLLTIFLHLGVRSWLNIIYKSSQAVVCHRESI